MIADYINRNLIDVAVGNNNIDYFISFAHT